MVNPIVQSLASVFDNGMHIILTRLIVVAIHVLLALTRTYVVLWLKERRRSSFVIRPYTVL